MANSYENEVNELVDGIMKAAEEATTSSGMEKEAGVFKRRGKSEIAANKTKANEMFSGEGSDDSASDPRSKVQKKWKRIKAKFFKKANNNTEEMIEKIAAAAGTEVDMLLDYIEKIAAEEDLDGQDIVDTLYEEIEDEPDYEEEDEFEDEDDEDEDDEDEDEFDEEDEEYGEEVEASMINDAMEKIAAVTGMDEDTVADYIVSVAAENEVDELEVLAALEDEADEVLEKQAMKAPAFVGKARNFAGDKKDKIGAFAGKHQKGLKIGGGVAAAAGLAGAGYGGYKLYQKKKAKAEAEKQALEVLIDEAIEKVAYVAGVDSEDVIDYVEKLAYENDVDEIEVLAELEKEAKFVGTPEERKAYQEMVASITPTKVRRFKGSPREHLDQLKMRAGLFGMNHPNIQRAGDFVNAKGAQVGNFAKKNKKGLMIGGGLAAAAGAGYGGYKYMQKRKAQAEAEKEAFEMMVDEAIEKVAYVSGVDGEDVIDYVEKLAYENDLDEIEVLAELEKEAMKTPEFVGKARNFVGAQKNKAGAFAKAKGTQVGSFVKKNKKGMMIGGGLAAATGAGYGGYKYMQKRKAQAEESEE